MQLENFEKQGHYVVEADKKRTSKLFYPCI